MESIPKDVETEVLEHFQESFFPNVFLQLFQDRDVCAMTHLHLPLVCDLLLDYLFELVLIRLRIRRLPTGW